MAVVSAPSFVVDKQDVTTFVDDQAVAAARVVTSIGSLPQGTLEEREHTIDSVLSRPVKLSTLTWADTDAPRKVLGEWLLLEDYFAAHANALSKVAGIGYMKADARIRVMVNAPLMFGRLRLVILPQTAVRDDPSQQTLGFYTACPGVEIDVGDGGTGECVVPWVNYRMWANVDKLFQGGFDSQETQDYFDHARALLVVLENLGGSTNATSATVTVSATLENVHVKQAVPPRAMPVMTEEYRKWIRLGRRPPKRGVRMDPIQSWVELSRPKKEKEKSMPKPNNQGFGKVMKKTEAAAYSTIDGMSKAVTDVSGAVVSVAAATVGASVPPVEVTMVEVLDLGLNRELANAVGPTGAVNLGLSRVDRVQPGATSGDDCFHNINRYAANMAHIDTFAFKTSDTPGKIIWSMPVTPGILNYDGLEDGLPAAFATVPVSFASMFFRYYRGGLKLRLSAVKNSFFSGRLRVIYIPTDTEARTSPITDEDQASSYNIVWDVKTGSEAIIDIPYVSALPWTQIHFKEIGGQYEFSDHLEDILGFIYVVVYNELIIPDTITAEEMRILAYFGGGEDLEFNGYEMRGCVGYKGWDPVTNPQPESNVTTLSGLYLNPAPGPPLRKMPGPTNQGLPVEEDPSPSGEDPNAGEYVYGMQIDVPIESLEEVLEDINKLLVEAGFSLTMHRDEAGVIVVGRPLPEMNVPDNQGAPVLEQNEAIAQGEGTSGVYQNSGIIQAKMSQTTPVMGAPALLAFSHRITSFKELCNRPVLVKANSSSPHWHSVANMQNVVESPMGMLRSTFAYSVGGTRIYAYTGNEPRLCSFCPTDDLQLGVGLPLMNAVDNNAGDSNKMGAVIPWQDQFYFLPTSGGVFDPTSNSFGTIGQRQFISMYGARTIAVAAADDFELFYRIGPPIVFMFDSTTNTEKPFTMNRGSYT